MRGGTARIEIMNIYERDVELFSGATIHIRPAGFLPSGTPIYRNWIEAEFMRRVVGIPTYSFSHLTICRDASLPLLNSREMLATTLTEELKSK